MPAWCSDDMGQTPGLSSPPHDMKRLALAGWLVPPRSHCKELLDAESIPSADLHGNLADLGWLNRYLGSCWIVCASLQRLWQTHGCPSHLRVLDIGTGAGDIPMALVRWSRRRGVQLTVVALDNHDSVVRYARDALSTEAAITVVRGDGLGLPVAPQSFDIVVCSSMLHHLEWEQGVTLVRSMATAARIGFIVNDLRRSRVHYWSARLLLALLSRNRLTRHDGPLSVLRAYSVAELRVMAREAGVSNARVASVLSYRMQLISSL